MLVTTPHPSLSGRSVTQSRSVLLLYCSLFLSAPSVAQQPTFPPGIELPAGAGRELILQACTRCHDLKGVPAYKGYWTRQQWLAMIETMIKHGAPLDARQAAEVAGYLALHFGRQPVSVVPAVP